MAPLDSPDWHGFFRIAHMGHLNPHMVLGALASVQAGMAALGIPFRRGGLDAATEVIAQATRRGELAMAV